MKTLLLIGGNRDKDDGPLLTIALIARELGYQVKVISEPWHLNLEVENGDIFRTALENNSIDYVEQATLSPSDFEIYRNSSATCILLNAVWFLKEDFLNIFPNRVFNYHAAKLPEERGAAGNSWKILSNSKTGALTLHHVVPELDQGMIALQHPVSFPENCHTCSDFYAYLKTEEKALFSNFLTLMMADELPPPEAQKEEEALYWPRLLTSEHGYINWEWSGLQIERFIHAFDEPHPGAMSFIQEKKVRLRGVRLLKSPTDFHPFQAGIVVRKHKDHIFIATVGGLLKVTTVMTNT
jgi:methionyl-tRNA formyltransferase